MPKTSDFKPKYVAIIKPYKELIPNGWFHIKYLFLP